MRKLYLIIVIALFGTIAYAQTVVQGTAPNREVGSNVAARFAGKTTEVTVTNAAGGTTVPATAFVNRKSIELQNLGPNAIYCTVDGTAPLATGANGRRVDANGGTWALDVGSGVVVKCIAATAAQVTTAATMVTELR